MAVFKSTKSDKVVTSPNGGFITFKDGYADVSDKKDIEALGKAKGVKPLTAEEEKAYKAIKK